MIQPIKTLAIMSLLALGQSALLAATGEVTLSGSTWTGKVDGVTKYTGTSLSAAFNACDVAMSSGTINIRNSGSTGTTIMGIGSNKKLDAHNCTVTANGAGGAGSCLLRSANTANIQAYNMTMAGTAQWFGLYFSTCNGMGTSVCYGQGGGIAYRVDNCKGGPGYNLAVGSENVSGAGGHGIETMGINGSSFNIITSNDHTDGCGLLIQSVGQTAANTVTTVAATRCCYGGGYAGFRTANNNRNTTVTYDNATSCGRGYFSVSGSTGCTLTRVNANNCPEHGVLIQSAASTHVNGGTVANCHPCSLITADISPGGNTCTVTCQ